MTLNGLNIHLRALEPEDANTLYEWENNAALWSLSYTTVPFSRYTLEEYSSQAHQDIYTNKQLRLMICLNEGHRPAGVADLFDFDAHHQRCGVGIYVHEAHQGKGHASECLRIVKDYAFSILYLRQLFAQVNISNAASLALFDKAGFERTGIKKAWHRIGHAEYEDVVFLQCLNPGS